MLDPIYDHFLFGSLSTTTLKHTLNSAHNSIIDSGPYGLFLGIIIIVFVILYRTQRQLARNSLLRKQLAYDTRLANDKTSFLRLVSRFLRPPMAIIQSGITMAENDSAKNVGNIRAVAYDLNNIDEKIITRIDSDQALHHIRNEPVWPGKKLDTLKSRLFFVPTLLLLLCLFGYNAFFWLVAHHTLNPINLIVQAVLFTLIVQLLFSTINNNVLMRHENERIQALIKFYRQLDTKRSIFAHETQYSLMYAVMKLQESAKSITNDQFRNYTNQGIQSYNLLLSSFRILSQLEHTKLGQTTEQPSINGAIADSIQAELQHIQAKQLNIDIANISTTLKPTIQTSLLIFVLRSILQAAINSSLDGTRINIDCQATDNTLAINITDHGNGTLTEKLHDLDNIADHAKDQQTNAEAIIALNMYLSRMIAHAYDGKLTVTGSEGKGTNVVLSLPVHV